MGVSGTRPSLEIIKLQTKRCNFQFRPNYLAVQIIEVKSGVSLCTAHVVIYLHVNSELSDPRQTVQLSIH